MADNPITAAARLVHRNPELILIQLMLTVAKVTALLLFVGLPVGAALVGAGVDISEFEDPARVAELFQDPLDLLAQYGTVLVAGLIGLSVYLVFAYGLGVYVLGGSAGVLSRSVLTSWERFRTAVFLGEARRRFWPLVGLTTLAGLGAALVGGAALLVGVLVLAAVGGVGIGEAGWAGQFLGALAAFGMIAVVLLAGVLFLVVTGGGIAIVVSRDLRAWDAVREVFSYLDRTPSFVSYVTGLSAMAALVLLGAFMVGAVAGALPGVGLILQMAIALLEGYVTLVWLAAVLQYYERTSGGTSSPAAGTSAP
jgi:hypothetical protein